MVTKNTMIRSVPTEHITRLDELARQRVTSRNDLILQAIAVYIEAADPHICLGWIEIDRPGDVPNLDDVCPECGYDLAANPPLFVALMADGSVYGPVCQLCATSS